MPKNVQWKRQRCNGRGRGAMEEAEVQWKRQRCSGRGRGAVEEAEVIAVEAQWLVEEKGAAVRWKATLEAEANHKAEAEAKQWVEQPNREMLRSIESLGKQKGQAEGEWVTCDQCATWGFSCKVSQNFFFLSVDNV